MDLLIIGILGIICLVILLFAGMNIGFAMLSVGFAGFAAAVNLDAALGLLKSNPFNTTANFSLSVIPLFVMMGQFAYHSGLSTDLYKACYKWLGRMPGGLAIATIGACAGFSAICGSSTATAATMGTVCLPEMRKYKYANSLSTGSVAAGGTLGILIPPSVGFILYGITAEQSIGKLFAAGFLPGALLTLYYMATIVISVKRNPGLGSKGEHFTFREKLSAIKGIAGVMALFIIVIGGIFGGIFTPNEGAAVGAIGAFIFMVARGKCTLETVKQALLDTVKTSSMIFMIIIGAFIFGYFLTVTKLPLSLAEAILNLNASPYVVLILILALYCLMGCIMDSLAMILLLVPIFLPVIMKLGMDPVWFGVLMVMIMETGLITPPVGMNVFVVGGVAKDVPMQTIFKGIFPFLIALLLAVATVMIFPQIALFLPSIIY
ncbi:MAG: TRAP transporter large permease [Peptococcaceae bacterium]|nr:TRAP transporter large permease [Peptococcaceae bacterium]